MDFLEIRRNFGQDEMRCRDLFSAAWIPDIFMKRVEMAHSHDRKKGEKILWTMLCPHEYPELLDCYGEEFEKKYLRAEKDACQKRDNGQPVVIR